MCYKDQSVSDYSWWFSEFSEFENFVGIGEKRVRNLADRLRWQGVNEYIINRLLKANDLPHGPCNRREELLGNF